MKDQKECYFIIKTIIVESKNHTTDVKGNQGPSDHYGMSPKHYGNWRYPDKGIHGIHKGMANFLISYSKYVYLTLLYENNISFKIHGNPLFFIVKDEYQRVNMGAN